MKNRNMLCCDASGTDVLRFMNLCRNNGITLERVKVETEGYSFLMASEDYLKLSPLIQKTGIHIHIRQRMGPAFVFYRHTWRKIFLTGLLFFTAVIYLLSLFIWNIQVDDNSIYTDTLIRQYLASEGIAAGVPKSQIHPQEIEEELRLAYQQMTWVSVEVKGTQLLIHTTEGIHPEDSSEASQASSLTAPSDGVIISMYTRSGTPMKKVGETAAAGEVIVDGRVPVYNEDAAVRGYQYVSADADILFEREINYNRFFSRTYEKRSYTGKKHTRWGAVLFGQYITSPGHFHYFETSDTIEEYINYRLTPSFYLPISWIKMTDQEYITQSDSYTDDELYALAESTLSNYLTDLEKKGIQITENSVKIHMDKTGCSSQGSIGIREYVNTREIIDSNAQASDRLNIKNMEDNTTE